MQFHHYGYVTGDPRVQPAAGTGLNRPADMPETVDVLIVGAGPAGMLLAAQMSQYPTVSTRLIERRAGRLEIGQADGIQARSVETFQAFGFAERLVAEAFRLTAMNFWGPDPADPSKIIRTRRTEDDPDGIERVPAPHHQPGAGPGLLRRGRRSRPREDHSGLRLRVHRAEGHRGQRVPGPGHDPPRRRRAGRH